MDCCQLILIYNEEKKTEHIANVISISDTGQIAPFIVYIHLLNFCSLNASYVNSIVILKHRPVLSLDLTSYYFQRLT